MDFAYPVDLTPLEDGRMLARVPDLKGCVTDGADRDEALREAGDALGAVLSSAILRGQPIAPPSPAAGRPVVSPRAVIAAKAALYCRMRDEGLTIAVLAERLGVADTEVRRLLDPRHNSKISRLEDILAEHFDLQLAVSFSPRTTVRPPASAGVGHALA